MRNHLGLILLAIPQLVQAQHEHERTPAEVMPEPFGISAMREGSGTSWLPTATPMYAMHAMGGAWELMLHGNIFAQYLNESGNRGDAQFGSVNWVMGMAHRPAMSGKLGFHFMLSADPLTVGGCGYPDLLATGEFCNGAPLHDRQHPHDMFMELSVMYEQPVSKTVGIQFYGGPVAEPALGPVAYPHRISAMPGPSAPIGHHWQDATHVSFGVFTAGLFGKSWKLEGSVFNGREPDENRYDFDFGPLDSYSGRFWFLPNDNWALQASVGRLIEAEPAHNGTGATNITRATTSATYHRLLNGGGIWASTFVWGRNYIAGSHTSVALAETVLNLAERNVFNARAEFGAKTGEELVLSDPALHDRTFTIGKLSAGYIRKLGAMRGLVPGIGGQLSLSLLPSDLAGEYGRKTNAGLGIYLNLRAAPVTHDMNNMAKAPAPETVARITAMLGEHGIETMKMQDIQQPFFSKPTSVLMLHGAATPAAAVQVTLFPNAEAAYNEGNRVASNPTIGWAAPTRFYVAENALIAVLLDPTRDEQLYRKTLAAFEMLRAKPLSH